MILYLTLFITLALSAKLRIADKDDFISFLNTISSGSNYYIDTTVFIDNDISLDGEILQPTGKISYGYFCGVLDGRGHVLSNLHMNSALDLTGLFGYSSDSTVKNIVMDDSCTLTYSQTITSTGSAIDMGSIIGYCDSCTVVNNVNLASIAFTGNVNDRTVVIGGITARLTGPSTLRNCANYGTLTHAGSSTDSFIGGIVGLCSGTTISIQNTINHGTIMYNGASSGSLYIGGVIGNSYSGSIVAENCVSAGKVDRSSQEGNSYVGSVVGYAGSGVTTKITRCLWTNDVKYDNACGSGDVTASNSGLKSLDATTINELNEYTENKGNWSKWIFNPNEENITFIISNNKGFIVSTEIILLPTLIESDGLTFKGWFNDSYCTDDLITLEMEESITLYALYGQIVAVKFDGNEGIPSHSLKYVTSNATYGVLPNAERVGHTLNGWYDNNEGTGEMITPASIVHSLNNHTLYANWSLASYTVMFDYGNGIVANMSVFYNRSITYPNSAIKEGYTFGGWDINITVMPAHDINVTALWNINSYTITFIYYNGTKDERTLNYSDVIEYPQDDVKEGYTFIGWLNYTETMPAYNLTVTSKWAAILYQITFDFNNGSSTKKTFAYNDTIIYPQNIKKEGYIFIGWSTDYERMPSKNVVVTAQWAEANLYVEITIANPDLSEAEILDMLKKYTKSIFYVDSLEINTLSGSTQVIIRFENPEEAHEFARKVSNDIKEGNSGYIREVYTIKGRNATSFSHMRMTISYTLFILFHLFSFAA